MFPPTLLTSDSSSRNWLYDVFPSFSGEDVRKKFLSHLLRELDGKSIDAFKDNEIERSHSISPELVKAIRGSRIALVLFSKNYASSSWCLNELLEILKCMKEFGQVVIPIFYDLDPSHVRKQMGDFGEAFKKTCKKQKEKGVIDQWKKALTDAANLSGYDSMNWDSDAAGVVEICSDISGKLYSTPSNEFENFVGIKDHITKITSILHLESTTVGMVGIWGTSGIGKTTISRALFNNLSKHFQNSVYVDKAFISKSEEAFGRPYLGDHNMTLSIRENFLGKMDMKGAFEEKLKHRKVLTIIDDLNDQYVLDALAGKMEWFGRGSRIIVVTNDKHILKAHGIDSIYEVDLPSHELSLEIFCRAAFSQKFPPYGLEMFATEVVQWAGHLPLGLTVLGSSLRGLNKEACLNMLPRLQRNLNGKIEATLKVSYDGLGNEEDKAIFRHIACYFNHVEAKDIKLFLADSKLDVGIGLDNLFDKSLIHERFGLVEMHSLLKEMGRNIVRKQSIDEPGRREFLVDSKDICQVLQNGTGTEKLLGISLNIDEIDELHIHESAFLGMHNLRFLEIRNNIDGKLTLPENFKLPHKLKLLIWPDYPERYMPFNFCPESLVKLEMQHSNLYELWEGIMSLTCLKEMDLSNSKNLKEIPNLCMATNLEKLNLSSCQSLVKLPSSIRNLNKLLRLDMQFCTNLQVLPSGINLKSLEHLDLDGCKMLRTFPEISTNISFLSMKGTSVEEFPSNFPLDNLARLYMENINVDQVQVQQEMQPLSPIWSMSLIIRARNGDQVGQGMAAAPIRKGHHLTQPFMSMLSPSLTSLMLRNIPNLVELPSSFQNLNKLEELEITDCVNLEILPRGINIKSLYRLDLSGCSRLRSFPDISTNISNLNLSRTGIKMIPYCTIIEFSRLRELYMESCSKLEYVHLDISKLKHLNKADFSHCGALTGVDLSSYGIGSGVAIQADNALTKRRVFLQFTSCSQLDQVLLLQHSVMASRLVDEMFILSYRIPPNKDFAGHVDVEFCATLVGDSKFELQKWGIQIYKHCDKVHQTEQQEAVDQNSRRKQVSIKRAGNLFSRLSI